MPGRGGSTIGRDLPPGQMTFAGLAKATGVPVNTLRRWFREDKIKALRKQRYGEIEVNIFGLDAIVQVTKIRESEEY